MKLTVGHIDRAAKRTPPKPKHGAEFAPKLVSRFEKLPEVTQKTAVTALSKFSRESLEKLHKSGNRIIFKRGKEGCDIGSYDSERKIIYVGAVPEGDASCGHTINHETTHALATVRWEDENGFLTRLITPDRDRDFSRHDAKLAELHKDYTQRSLVGLGHHIADSVDLKGGAEKGEYQIGGRSLKWKKTEEGIEFKERGGMLGRIANFAGTDLKKGIAYSAVGLGVGLLVAGATGPVAAVAAGVTGLTILGNGLRHLGSAARSISKEVSISGFQSDQVSVSGTRVRVKLDQELQSDQKMTSAYATLERQPEEYLAESMVTFLESDESREKLKERDPKMHDYCMEWNIHS